MFRSMLRGLLTHKLRLALSALAVVLGTMFMAGAFVAGDTFSQGFTALFSTVNQDIDVGGFVPRVTRTSSRQRRPATPRRKDRGDSPAQSCSGSSRCRPP